MLASSNAYLAGFPTREVTCVFHSRKALPKGLEACSEWNGLLMEKEVTAQEILTRQGGEAVHVHEIELEKRAEDIPLHSLRPDLWLGDERLGRTWFSCHPERKHH